MMMMMLWDACRRIAAETDMRFQAQVSELLDPMHAETTERARGVAALPTPAEGSCVVDAVHLERLSASTSAVAREDA